MSANSNEIESLGSLETGVLEKRGWHFVTYFQTRQQGEGSSAYNKAVAKASSHERQAGIRSKVKDGVTYWEIWEHW